MKKLLSLFFVFLISTSLYAEDCTASDDSGRDEQEEQVAESNSEQTADPTATGN